MQYIEGTSAGAAIRSGGPQAVDYAVFVIGETAKALDYAHSEGVLHRDVKPDNILLEHDGPGLSGRVLLADFGIAKALSETAHLTQTGMLVASLQYAAPEQFDGAELDVRTDVYALGCTLFHLMTGQPPYPGETLPQLMRGHLMTPVPRASATGPELGSAWDAVFERALAKARDDRYASAGALAAAAKAAQLARADSFPQADTLHAPVPRRQAALESRRAGMAATDLSPARPPSERSTPSHRGRLTLLGVGAAVLVLLLAGIWIFRHESTRGGSPSATSASAVAPSAAPATSHPDVMVFNISDQEGLASAAAQKLQANGWNVSATGNFSLNWVGVTTVFCDPDNPGEQEAANAVARVMGTDRIQSRHDVDDPDIADMPPGIIAVVTG